MIDRLIFGTAKFFTTDKSQRKKYCSLLENAYESGVRSFDTAPSYGSESLLGDVFYGVEDIAITSKIGTFSQRKNGPIPFYHLIYQRHFKSYMSRFPRLKKDIQLLLKSSKSFKRDSQKKLVNIDKKHIENSVELSLKVLKRDKLDCFLLHEPKRFIFQKRLIQKNSLFAN